MVIPIPSDFFSRPSSLHKQSRFHATDILIHSVGLPDSLRRYATLSSTPIMSPGETQDATPISLQSLPFLSPVPSSTVAPLCSTIPLPSSLPFLYSYKRSGDRSAVPLPLD
ncbi:hypothetical protein B0H19DRAFT_1264777 [Mycena capillaripes]|nr:hypothetical protein B0H19DRAFT_1264777 [Mycena capillaripes]